MSYNKNNIFARILRGEVPATIVYEDAFILAFNDLHPKAPVHVLAIPKGSYTSSDDFFTNAPEKEIVGFYRGVGKTLALLEISPQKGFRLVSNTGPEGGQEIPHFHIHILAGKPMGPMTQRID